MNEFSYISGENVTPANKRNVELRTCRDCGYVTFTKYVACPKCGSEKWDVKN